MFLDSFLVINFIIKTSLAYCLANNSSFEQLLDVIKFITNQRLTDILMAQKNFKERYILADHLYFLKKEIKIFGNKSAKLIE